MGIGTGTIDPIYAAKDPEGIAVIDISARLRSVAVHASVDKNSMCGVSISRD